ncbi:putative phosphatidate cytidylyltransferase [Saccharomycopsis crataegensis]|uniref:Phosphatidate cytidylyltransferase, mitochondrial n=1 Tax=Saccharomycopsis crataegensis TaxID=43959 RepID=A0AAV5QE54_9ASCO|nr:putative phosphatidate cytidylyltransferase [Saccharomycopsis crataegensis]
MLKTRSALRSFSTISPTHLSQSKWVYKNSMPLDTSRKVDSGELNMNSGKFPKMFEEDQTLMKNNLDLSLLDNAFKKYEKITLNSLESTYLTSKISPLDTAKQLKNYLIANKKDTKFETFKNFNYLPINFALNQNIKLKNPETAKNLREIMKKFRNVPVKYCFAYGSNVFKQQNNNGANKQTDLIMATTFPDHFHSLNLNRNEGHYSFLKRFGSDFISKVENMGPGVYFNPYVKVGDQLVKYGVVSIEKCVSDLLSWDNMYLAGRLHKPVKIIRDDPRVRFINQENLRNAAGVSLLLLSSQNLEKKQFTLAQLFEAVAGLSYQGDIRTKIGGENPKKVQNIVAAQNEEFKELYAPLLDIFKFDEFISFTDASSQNFQINDSPIYKAFIIENLPSSFKTRLYKRYLSSNPNTNSPISTTSKAILDGTNRAKFSDVFQTATTFSTALAISQKNTPISTDVSQYSTSEEFVADPLALEISQSEHLNDLVLKSLSDTILYPSIVQSIKGVFTAGVSKSWSYAAEKRKKYKSA